MEQKPHKKEELMVANSVLKLAEDLLKVSTLRLTHFADMDWIIHIAAEIYGKSRVVALLRASNVYFQDLHRIYCCNCLVVYMHLTF
jgi:hypothetical protein